METPKLEKVNKCVICNKNNAAKFKHLVDKCKDPESKSRYQGILSVYKFKWATAYAIMQLQSSNFKRNGNIMKIKVKYARKRLQHNLKKCRHAKKKGAEEPA